MNSQEYYLNIRPGDGYPQTVKVSQGDVGRPLLFHLMDGVNPLSIPAGATITIHGTKPSGLGFTETCTVSGSSAAISTTLDITQEYGLFPAELVVSVNGDIIATANFSLFVERSPHPDGTTDGTKEELDDLYTEVANLKEDIDEIKGGGTGVSEELKTALLQLASKVAYIDDDGADYYNDLQEALYPPVPATGISLNKDSLSFTTIGATATLEATVTPPNTTNTITWSSSDDTVATVDELGVVTTVSYGSAIITVSAGRASASCAVVVATASVVSISAVYTQSGTVYDTATLESLKDDLVVTATWSDSSTSVVPSESYTLTGTLTVGTSTITVSYGGQTDTFTVTVTKGALYPIPEGTGSFAGTGGNVVSFLQSSASTKYLYIYRNISYTSSTRTTYTNKIFTIPANTTATLTLKCTAKDNGDGAGASITGSRVTYRKVGGTTNTSAGISANLNVVGNSVSGSITPEEDIDVAAIIVGFGGGIGITFEVTLMVGDQMFIGVA